MATIHHQSQTWYSCNYSGLDVMCKCALIPEVCWEVGHFSVIAGSPVLQQFLRSSAKLKRTSIFFRIEPRLSSRCRVKGQVWRAWKWLLVLLASHGALCRLFIVLVQKKGLWVVLTFWVWQAAVAGTDFCHCPSVPQRVYTSWLLPGSLH